MRTENVCSSRSRSTTFSSPTHASIFFGVVRRRNLYHLSFSILTKLFVGFSEASAPFKLESPETFPPQPPTTKLHGSSPTGNVNKEKKSFPSVRLASHEIS